MTFADMAAQLAGQTALVLHWRPDDFWNATPAELAAVVAVLPSESGTTDSAQLAQLMQQFPDGDR